MIGVRAQLRAVMSLSQQEGRRVHFFLMTPHWFRSAGTHLEKGHAHHQISLRFGFLIPSNNLKYHTANFIHDALHENRFRDKDEPGEVTLSKKEFHFPFDAKGFCLWMARDFLVAIIDNGIFGEGDLGDDAWEKDFSLVTDTLQLLVYHGSIRHAFGNR